MYVFDIAYEGIKIESLFEEQSLFDQIMEYLDIEYLRWSGKRNWEFFLESALDDILGPLDLLYYLNITYCVDCQAYDIFVYENQSIPATINYYKYE